MLSFTYLSEIFIEALAIISKLVRCLQKTSITSVTSLEG